MLGCAGAGRKSACKKDRSAWSGRGTCKKSSGKIQRQNCRYNEEAVVHDRIWEEFRKKHIEVPVYLTIDKDILDPSQVKTNWNQGKMKLADLKKVIYQILLHEQVIGVDICGECTGSILEEAGRKEMEQDDRINGSLLHLLEC